MNLWDAMAKKRKADGRPFGRKDLEPAVNGNSKLIINDWQDVANSEDEFHINQDKILLEEGPAQKRRRKAEEESQEKFLGAFRTSS